MTASHSAVTSSRQGSPLSPFKHRAFAVMWTAVLVSNIGIWMQNAGAGWLMTSLDPDPRVVSMVQVATALPIFLFGVPAGALADILDRRRLLLTMEVVISLVTALFVVLLALDRVSPASLLAFIFISGIATALIAPAWQAIVPQLVGSNDLASGIALNSTGINISRAIGPALAGFLIAYIGIGAPFSINVVTNLACVGALLWWRPPKETLTDLPAERFGSAIVVGLRHARYNRPLRATLLRATGFFLFASAYWALLPLVARDQVAGGPGLYGVLLGAIGVGAVAGAFVLPRFKAQFGPDRVVALGSAGTALALLLFGLARHPAIALAASALSGLSWIAVVATLNVSAQVALPAWVRGRGLAVYVTVMFGSMALGSLIWGEMASLIGLPAAQHVAAALALVAVPMLRRWKLNAGADLDLTPSMHWPAPLLSDDVDDDRGPVLITVEYRIAPRNEREFLNAIGRVALSRKREGAYEWHVFEDVAEKGRWLETFLVDSWLEHLRQHERVTNADRALEEAVLPYQTDRLPKVTHYIAGGARSAKSLPKDPAK